MLTDLLYRLRAILRRNAMEDELDEELRFHLTLELRRFGQPEQETLSGIGLSYHRHVNDVPDPCRL